MWKSPNRVTKNETNYVLTYRRDIVTELTVISQVIIGSDNTMAIGSIKQDIEEHLMNKNR